MYMYNHITLFMMLTINQTDFLVSINGQNHNTCFKGLFIIWNISSKFPVFLWVSNWQTLYSLPCCLTWWYANSLRIFNSSNFSSDSSLVLIAYNIPFLNLPQSESWKIMYKINIKFIVHSHKCFVWLWFCSGLIFLNISFVYWTIMNNNV